MNWYKKSKYYLEVGHDEDFVLWFSPDGREIIKSGNDISPNTTHAKWYASNQDNRWALFSGRYDKITKEISVVGVEYRSAPKSLINSLLIAFPDTKTIYVFNDIKEGHETIRVANKLNKKSQYSEWWIIDSNAVYADGDVGDMNHEAYVIDSIKRKYIYDEFDKGEWIDWDGFKKELAMEAFEEKYGKKPTEQYYQKYIDKMEDLYLEKLKEMGMTDEEYALAEGIGDAREYGLKNLGWKRVKQNNIQTQTLTVDDLKEIANGLYDINNDLDENSDAKFNIEVVSTGAFYTDVPYKLISDGAPSQLRQYQNVYAKNISWYKFAQIWNVEYAEGIDDKLTALYELEYKYSMLRDRSFNGMEERKENILRELENKLREVVDDIKDTLLRVFSKWLNSHALLSADTWSIQRTEEFAEEGDPNSSFRNLVDEYIRYAINGGDGNVGLDKDNYDKYFMEIINKALENLRYFPRLSLLLEGALSDYKNMMYDELSYEGYKEFGEHKNKRFRNKEQAEEWIDRQNVNQLDPEILGFNDIKTFADMAHNMGFENEIAIELYKKFVFPHWVQYWKGQGIANTRKTISNIYKKLQSINSNNVRNAMAIISIALNASHQTGEMMDYISQEGGGSGSVEEVKELLDSLSRGSHVEEWNRELREIGVQI